MAVAGAYFSSAVNTVGHGMGLAKWDLGEAICMAEVGVYPSSVVCRVDPSLKMHRSWVGFGRSRVHNGKKWVRILLSCVRPVMVWVLQL